MSKYPALLASRNTVLAKYFPVTGTCSVDGLQVLPESLPVQVLVLCQTLSAPEVQEALRVTHERWPLAKILLVAGTQAPEVAEQAYAVRPGLAGPAALIAAVKRQLSVVQLPEPQPAGLPLPLTA